MNYIFLDASSSETFGQIGVGDCFYPFQWQTEHDLASRITRLCDEMLQRVDLKPYDIGRFGFCAGPGSLTGLRVAAAFMRALALSTESPLSAIDLFTWSAYTLSVRGITGKIKLTVPALLNRVFAVDFTLPLDNIPRAIFPKLDMPGPAPDGTPTWGIRYEAPNVSRIDPSPTILHDLMHFPAATDFKSLLESLPLYVIPSQAEINLEKKRSEKK